MGGDTLEGVFGQLESTVISRFLGRWPKESMTLGDNSGSPERRRVVFAALPKEGAPFAVGGKYSEVIFAWVIAETQTVAGEVETERSAEDDEERRAGLYTPKKEMNQILEHGVVISFAPEIDQVRLPRVESDGRCLPLSSSILILSHFPPATPDQLSHTYIHLPSPWLRRASLTEQASLHTSIPSPAHKQVHDVDYRVFAQAMPHPRISL